MLKIVEIREIDGKQYVGVQGQTDVEILRDHERFVEENNKRAAELLRKKFQRTG